MTGYGRPEDRQQALATGFNVHLVKPVDVEELSRMLDELWVVRGHASRQEGPA